jgi:hypothetical protein
MTDLENWLETQMPPEEKVKMRKSYDKYFEGVPEAMRGMYINH